MQLQVFHGFTDDDVRHQFSQAAVAMGTFDGVHRGHAALIRQTVRWAKANGKKAIVLTFDPMPASVLRPERAIPPLIPLSERLQRFNDLGADAAIVHPFNRAVANVSPEDFLCRQLLGNLSPSAIFVGKNFTFGQGGRGTPSMIRQVAQKIGLCVEESDLVQMNGVTVSSTEIRRRLLTGDMTGATELLGRHFALEGQVIHGRARGRKMGFPTANVNIQGLFLPRRGVYAALALIQDISTPVPAVLNIGIKPTFGETDTTLEAFLLDSDSTPNLYEKRLRLIFLKYLREEKKFNNSNELADQISKDCQEAKDAVAREISDFSGTLSD